jgi:dynein light chain roadblock-type
MSSTEPKSPKKAASSLRELEETVARLLAHKGVTAVTILAHNSGDIVHSSASGDVVVQQAKLISKIRALSSQLFAVTASQGGNDASAAAAAAADDDPLSFIRIRSQKHEVMVAPQGDFVLVVWHDPRVRSVVEESL